MDQDSKQATLFVTGESKCAAATAFRDKINADEAVSLLESSGSSYKKDEDTIMDVSKIVSEIDAKIASLQQARAVLLGLDDITVATKPRRGRPKGSTNAARALAAATKPAKRKRNLSPEGRTLIQEAMKRRWAQQGTTPEKAAKKEATKK
jgi:hypothetical protein